MAVPTVDTGEVAPLPEAPGTGLCGHAAAELDAALLQLGRHGARLHEGVHQARKSLRRTRAILALGRGRLGAGAALVDRELRRLNSGLSTLRDAHALVETLDRLIAAHPDAETAVLLRRARRAAASRRAQIATRHLAADPALANRRALLATLRGALLALPWNAVDAAQIDAALIRSARRHRVARERALAHPDDAAWHRWRRRARRRSQQRRALLAIGADPDRCAGASEGFDKRATEQLGRAQDLALLLEHCERDSPFSKEDRAALTAFAAPRLARLRRRIIAAT